jgi:hypothetical protein
LLAIYYALPVGEDWSSTAQAVAVAVLVVGAAVLAWLTVRQVRLQIVAGDARPPEQPRPAVDGDGHRDGLVCVAHGRDDVSVTGQLLEQSAVDEGRVHTGGEHEKWERSAGIRVGGPGAVSGVATHAPCPDAVDRGCRPP